MSETWQGQVVGVLLALKREGVPFERAWRTALQRFPPPRVPGEGTLFDEQARAYETAVGFFERMAANAYDGIEGPSGSGNGPALRGFRAEMLRELDASEPAHRTRWAA